LRGVLEFRNPQGKPNYSYGYQPFSNSISSSIGKIDRKWILWALGKLLQIFEVLKSNFQVLNQLIVFGETSEDSEAKKAFENF
jgi:hypothetical protein